MMMGGGWGGVQDKIGTCVAHERREAVSGCCDQDLCLCTPHIHKDARVSLSPPPTAMESPANRACDHVLQVAFGFCTLGDLHHLVAVSRGWQCIVFDKMPRLGASATVLRVASATGSRLWRHLTSYKGDVNRTLQSRDIQHLTSIDCHDRLYLAHVAMLRGAVNLQHIRFCNDGQWISGMSMKALTTPSAQQLLSIQSICINYDTDADALGSLSTLTELDLRNAYKLLRLDWLASLTRIRDLTIDFTCHYNGMSSMTPESLTRGLLMAPNLTRLYLSEPPFATDTSHLAFILSGLPLLRTLELRCFHRVESLSFLSATTPHLTHLALVTFDCYDLEAVEAMHIVAHCRSLTRLQIKDVFIHSLPASVITLLEPPSKLLPCLQYFVCQYSQ
jgi:hypothetical protein